MRGLVSDSVLLYVLSHPSNPYCRCLLFANKPLPNKSDYDDHVRVLLTVVADPASFMVVHVTFGPTPDASPALGADPKVGVSELVFLYLPPTPTTAEKDVVMATIAKLRSSVEQSEALSFYNGWAREDEKVATPGEGESAGLESRVYVNLTGWRDIEAHARFMQSEDFKAIMPLLVGMEGLRHYELYHVKLQAA